MASHCVVTVRTYLRVVFPVLVALGAVARVEDHLGAGVVETGLVAADLARFRVQPELRRPHTHDNQWPSIGKSPQKGIREREREESKRTGEGVRCGQEVRTFFLFKGR